MKMSGKGESERAQLCAPSGHASVHAFQQSVIRFSRALMGEDDPGLAKPANALLRRALERTRLGFELITVS